MPRYKIGTQNRVVSGFSCDPLLLDWFSTYTKSKGMSRSALIESWIARYKAEIEAQAAAPTQVP